MSVVSNVIFSFSILEREDDIMSLVNKWLEDELYGDFGDRIDKVSGGTKHLETPLYAAGFNYFNLDSFIQFIKTVRWYSPRDVQVFIKGQWDDRFNEVNVFLDETIEKKNV